MIGNFVKLNGATSKILDESYGIVKLKLLRKNTIVYVQLSKLDPIKLRLIEN